MSTVIELINRIRTFDVNTLSHYWILQAFLPAIVRQKAGHIVRRPSPSVYSLNLRAGNGVFGPLSTRRVSVWTVLRFEGRR